MMHPPVGRRHVTDQLRHSVGKHELQRRAKQHACPSCCLSIPAFGYYGCGRRFCALRLSAAEIGRARAGK